MSYLVMASPVGALTLFEDEGALVAVEWGTAPEGDSSPLLDEAKRQLDAYLDGRLRQFDLPLAPAGTSFQARVWKAMSAIPYGQTRSYGELAAELHSGARPIGTACGRNPLPIIVPCHRILAAGGRLGGYSGGDGLPTKEWLLDLERRVSQA